MTLNKIHQRLKLALNFHDHVHIMQENKYFILFLYISAVSELDQS